MGIDLVAGGRSKKTRRTAPRYEDVYLKLLVKNWEQLQCGHLEEAVHEQDNKPPISLKRLITFMKGKEDKVAVIVGPVTDDKRVYEVPALKVASLRFTETARARIIKAGGECLTFDKACTEGTARSENGTPQGVGPVRAGQKITAGISGLIDVHFDIQKRQKAAASS